MASTALQAFRRTIAVDWPKQAEEEARRLLVASAREGNARIVAEQTARAGVAPGVDAYANTPGNRDLDHVKLPGPIVYRYDYRAEIARVAVRALRAASPIVSGLYRDSHFIFVNGVPIDGDLPAIGPRDELYIANLTVYARRLEVGLTESGRPFVIQVEPNIYGRTMRSVLIPRYRNVARITLDHVTVPDAYVVKGRLKSHYINKHGRRTRRRQVVGAPVRAPAIVIAPL